MTRQVTRSGARRTATRSAARAKGNAGPPARHSPAKTIGLLGGSFDPPHMGHVLLAAVGVAGLGLDEVWLLPCRNHPFGKPLAPFEHRVRMCRLAVAALGSRVRVETIEGELGKPDQPSYTVETVKALRSRHPGKRFRLLMGSDIAKDTPKWRDFDRLRQLAEPLIVPRMGHHAGRDAEGPATLPALSSTEVRARAARGLSLEGWVPRAVEEYLRKTKLYSGASKG